MAEELASSETISENFSLLFDAESFPFTLERNH